MTQDQQQPCPDDRLAAVMAAVQVDVGAAIDQVQDLSREFPADARLPFLLGSLLAGERRYEEAHHAMGRAVAIAPGYHIARYQLGFLQYTSGDAAAAAATWQPLTELGDEHPLSLFAQGLMTLARDEFEPAIALLSRGMALNTELAPVNTDIQLLIDTTRQALAAGPEAEAEEQSSAASLLLQQSTHGKTRH